jgi:Leucine-rich repeat (LRR) protein
VLAPCPEVRFTATLTQVLRNNGIGPHCSGLCGICRFSPEFPISLLELTSLRLIDLNSNELVFMPLEIAKLPKLEGLDVRDNAIANIPDHVMLTARSGRSNHITQHLRLACFVFGSFVVSLVS